MKKSEIFFGALRVPVDFLAAAGSFFVAKIIRLHPTWLTQFQTPADSSLEFSNFPEFVAIAGFALVIILMLNGMYRMRSSTRFSKELRKIIFLVFAWLMLIVAYFFFKREFFFSRLALAYTGVLAILFVSFGRLLMRKLQKLFWKIGFGTTKVLIIGTNPNSLTLAKTLQKNPRYRFLGFMESGETLDSSFSGKPIGTLPEFEKIIRREGVEEVVIASRKLSREKSREILEFCRTNHVDFRFVPSLLEVLHKNVDFETLKGIPLISLRPTPLTGWGRVLKRVFDLLAALLTLIITSPVWIITAIGIKFDSPGPIFFLRKDNGEPVLRVGKHGKFIRFIKFRSMKAKSDSLRYSEELAGKNTRAGTPLVKIKNDPRITKFGKFLRKYSIDELPQLLCVIKGDMSLVGPRPHLPEEVEKYQPHHRRVLTIKPGITGLAQVSGRSDLDFEEEVALDTWYIENWSLWLDLKILFRTISVVIFPKHKE